jgi:dTDP-4-amino-4,6-dideoxygalactose transaminase
MLFPKRLAIGPSERAAILECVSHYRRSEDDLPYGGVFYQRYVDQVCRYFGVSHAIAVSSGTAALFVAIRALDLPPGSTVVCSPITDPGCISAIAMNGLRVRLADCCPDSFSMDADRVVDSLSDKDSAVLYVHLAGHATDLAPLRAELDRRGKALVEDVSQAHGAAAGGRKAGTFGHVAALSTMYRKAHVTGSNGGVILTNDADVHRRAVRHADRGKDKLSNAFDDRNPVDYDLPGLNFNIDEISCAIGHASLSRLDDTRAKRIAYVDAVRSMLAAGELDFAVRDLGAEDSPFLVPVAVPPDWTAGRKIDFAARLRDAGVPLNPHYQYLVSDWRWARGYGLSTDDLPRAKAAQERMFCLYVNERYGVAEAEFVIAQIRRLLKESGAGG